MIRRSGRLLASGRGGVVRASRRWLPRRRRKIFSPRCSARSAAGRMPPRCRCRLPVKATPTRRRSRGASAFCRRPGLLRAHLRRTLFPDLGDPSNESRAASCNSFCPASETKLVYGSNIDSAVTEAGKPYSELPNAFRYRNEIVAGCTCNGKDQFGLAQVKIEDDPTLAQGRYRGRRQRADGRRPQRRPARRRAEFLAGPAARQRALSARAGGGVGVVTRCHCRAWPRSIRVASVRL